ncbi:MAG: alpha/beta fold hydrolase [Myxococcota bacterium]
MALHNDIEIPTGDLRTLGARLYEPGREAVAQVVIHGATAVPQRFYDAFALHLAQQGFRVLTYDYRGIGQSRVEPIAEDPVTMEGWIEDAEAAQRWLVGRAPSLPLLTVGHSFGGQVAASIDAGRRPDGLILVGAQSGWWRAFPPTSLARMWLTWSVLLPVVTRSFGYVPGWTGLGEDLPAGVAQQWGRWCRSPNYFLSELPHLRTRLAAYDGRILALSFTDDELAPAANVHWLLDRLGGAHIDHLHLSPEQLGLPRVGHFGFFRTRSAPTLWTRAASFLLETAQKAGERGPRPLSPALEEILVDLHYGRD